MSSDGEKIAPASERGSTIKRLPRFTCIFAAVTVVGWIGGDLLTYPLPEAANWLGLIGWIGAIIAMPWLVVCAFLPKPRSAPLLLATLVIIQTVRMIDAQLDGGLIGVGFRIHASPIEQYIAKCHMFDFVDNGEKHAIGFCETTVFEMGFPSTPASLSIIYDPTGGFLKPEAQRSPEWKQALDRFKEYSGAWGPPEVRRRFGDFYLVLFAN
ncbi:hypothetical protein G8O24_03155 [Bradyrhizobium sp. INPA01-394B]|uniref:Uncharacterized protein n=1 Tax=Bradyrhizobium campsiandrae TaxID=1729892 RepID=A0ABR7U7V9_9BRAD|nr:hypothetical protein [Bradyrhizobium campsiandrae]MBC9876343.1 hypothetical protein [Bradyrhizobium campsiandrae]MBC9980134.1 hypothetical protein [Bradyrhizobium campsiandrae]